MSSTPMAAAQRESDVGPGQLRLALDDIETEFGAELDQPGIAGGSPAALRPVAAVQVLELPASDTEHALRLDDFKHPVTAYLNSLAPSSRRPQRAHCQVDHPGRSPSHAGEGEERGGRVSTARHVAGPGEQHEIERPS
jgi:hypothetical protein